MREHPRTLCQLTAQGHQTQTGEVFEKPAPIVAARNAFELHGTQTSAYPMVKQGELILDRSKGSGKVAGKPGEDTVERKNGFEVEVVATDGEGAYTVFEFLYGLLADRDAATGEMEA